VYYEKVVIPVEVSTEIAMSVPGWVLRYMSGQVYYEKVVIPVEVSTEIAVNDPGWVSRYRITEMMIREYATKVVYTLFSPDMDRVISVYEIPTRILLSTSVLMITEFLGVAKLAEIQQKARQQVQTQTNRATVMVVV
jgi:predicted nucleic acid-binding protein